MVLFFVIQISNESRVICTLNLILILFLRIVVCYGKGYYICIRQTLNKQSKNKPMKMKSLLLVTLASLGLTASTMAQNVPSYVPSNGLIGWWPFNGNANDESGNGNNGSVNGATLSIDRFGNANRAYSFDGITNEIIVPHNNALNLLPISISVWFKTSVSQPNKMLVNKYVCQSDNGYSFRLNFDKPSAFYFSNSSTTSNNFFYYYGIPIISDNDYDKLFLEY